MTDNDVAPVVTETGEIDLEPISQPEAAAWAVVAAYVTRIEGILKDVSPREIRDRYQICTPIMFMSREPLMTIMDLLNVSDAEEVMNWIDGLDDVQDALQKLGIKLKLSIHWADERRNPVGIEIYCQTKGMTR